MNKLESIYDLMGLFSSIPVGTEEKITINDVTITLSKTADSVNVKVEKEDNVCGYDDSEVKEIVKNYKDCINALDKDLFIDCLDELKENIPLVEFDRLLHLENYDPDTAERVVDLIDESKLIIHHILQEYIEEVVDEYERLTKMIEKFN